MLKFFYKNKLRYDKGQMAPLFIAILAILIIMAMVTVNLSKVSLVKTDSSNAVDAGALAAGSVMANVFNALAQANSQMESSYWEFYAAISVSFILALVSLVTAQIKAAAAETAAGVAFGLANSAGAQAAIAAADACPSPCSAEVIAANAAGLMEAAIASMGTALIAIGASMEAMESFIKTAWSISIAVTAYYLAQYYFYRSIREMAEEGRESAVKIGHQFAFMNSGIGSKLKEDDPEYEETGIAEEDNNYRKRFSDFLDNLGHINQYTYPWLDGQEREHYVEVNMDIEEVDTYDLKVAVLPFPVEIVLLGVSISTANAALAALTATETSYGTAETSYSVAAALYSAATGVLGAACDCQITYFSCISCCGPHHPGCCACAAAAFACWMAMCAVAESLLSSGMASNAAGLTANDAGLVTNASAISIMMPLYYLMAASWVGLLPGPVTYRSSSDDDALPFIICWMDDIVHNRQVRVDTIQHHQGVELGLWQMRYPDKIQSYSIVNFTGYGKIHPPDLRFDPSIIETDLVDTTDPYNPCVLTVKKADTLAKQADGLYNAADIYDAEALKMEEEARSLSEQGQAEAAEELITTAAGFREQAENSRTEAALKEQEVAELKAVHPQCFVEAEG